MSARDDVPAGVAGLELEALEEVWRHGEEGATVRTVLDAINARDEKQRAYTTLMTVLGRLHEKGLLERRRAGNADVYRATMTRERYMAARAQAEIEQLVDTYGDVALAGFVRRVSAEDPRRRARLRRLARRD